MNIIDFIKINGHKTFDELAFNEVDGLVLAQLAYLNYNNICTSFDDIIDSRSLNSYETSILLSQRDFGSVRDNQRLIREVLLAKRYYGIKFGHYVDEHCVDEEKQFSAITFILDDFICISYMGTDDTILGWKEDFSMSYSSFIASQKEASKYLDKIASLYDLPIIVTGHSKGGNLAIYAASNCDLINQDKILKVYSYDGPGFNKTFISSKKYLDLLDKLEVYIPESSFIGLIMYADDNYKIVASNKLFVFQHNVFNWLVDERGLLLKDKLSKKSIAFSESNRKWIETFTDNERKIFFETIFNLLEYNDKRSFNEIRKNWKGELTRIINSSKQISEEHKKLMMEIAKNLVATYFSLLFNKK